MCVCVSLSRRATIATPWRRRRLHGQVRHGLAARPEHQRHRRRGLAALAARARHRRQGDPLQAQVRHHAHVERDAQPIHSERQSRLLGSAAHRVGLRVSLGLRTI